MKKNLLTIATLIVVLGVLPVLAQAPVVKADIPFAFRAGEKLLPAGEYAIQTNHGNGTLLLRGPKASIFVLTNACQKLDSPEKGKLVFNRYGDTYFLSQVWHPGYTQGRILMRSPAEREMAARIGGTEVAQVRVEVK